MAQRRKKSTPFQKQKIVQAQYKNEFTRKLKSLIDTINGEEISSFLPAKVFDLFFKFRSHPFNVIESPECHIPPWKLSYIRKLISDNSKSTKITVMPYHLEVTLNEFFTVFLTIYLNLETIITDDFSYLASFKNKFKEFKQSLEETFEKTYDNSYKIFLAIGCCYNDVGNILYWLKHDMFSSDDREGGVFNLVTINSYKIEASTIIIDNHPRAVIRMGYAFPDYGIDWISLKPSELKIEQSHFDIPLDVFIQVHALQRLSERLDCLLTGAVHYNMFLSFKFPKVFYDTNHNILIEFRYFGTKAGYFRVDIIEGKIVIRTFLFVTNNGTPEGIKLGKITGLQKLDKQYLSLDKLSTFLKSGIGANESIREILISSGCQCLIDLYENHRSEETNTHGQQDAEFLLKYINYEKKHIPESMTPPKSPLFG